MITAIIISLFIVVIASTWWFGIWNNCLTLINLLLSGLIASSFYEPVATALSDSLSQYTSILGFVSIWLVFAVSFIVLRSVTDIMSSRKLRFDRITELVGQSILSIWIASVFTAFTVFTLHLSPLTPGDFQPDTQSSSVLGIGPGKMWAAFIQSRSRGALSIGKEANFFLTEYKQTDHPDDVELGVRVFDPRAQFIPSNIERRKQLAEKESLTGS